MRLTRLGRLVSLINTFRINVYTNMYLYNIFITSISMIIYYKIKKCSNYKYLGILELYHSLINLDI